MSHQARGLWGYTGLTGNGMPLTVQSTGIGASSATAVLGDLAGLGVRRIVRLGTCVAPEEGPAQGEVLLVEEAIVLDGASAHLTGGRHRLRPDPRLYELLAGLAPPVSVSSHDLVARLDPLGVRPDPEAAVRDLQTAATFAAGDRFEMKTAAILVVAGTGEGEILPENEIGEILIEVGRRVVGRLETHPD